MDTYNNGKDLKISELIFTNFNVGKKVLRRFFKRLNNYAKFYFFELWISRHFKFRVAENLDDYLKAYQIRYEVYCEEYNYLNPKDYPNRLEKDQYDPHSEHFLINNSTKDIVAYVRLILNSKEGFPIEKHFKLDLKDFKIDKNKTGEISRLIVSREYRRLHIILVLIKGLYKYVKVHGIEYIYSVMDDRLLNMLIKLGFPFRKIGPYTTYQGITCPNILVVKEMEDNLRKRNNLLYRYLMRTLK